MQLTTMVSRKFRKMAGLAAVAVVLLTGMPGRAWAQAGPNSGAVSFTGGVDVLPGAAYVFRGIVQESDPELTLWPYGDIGFDLFSGDGGVKSVGANVGVWNSLHTGSSGLDGPSDKLHYEEDFYATLSLGFDRGIALGTTYTSYTSPNAAFRTVKEISFKVAQDHWMAPYGVLAFELGDELAAGADGGNPGTYLELGVGPSFDLMPDGPALTIPVKIGLSLSDYYEGPSGDERFGFFDIGALITVPLSGVPTRLGSWNLHGGIDFLAFGDATELFNNGKSTKVVGLFGIGVSY